MSFRFYDSRVVKQAANGRWVDVLSRLGVDASRLDNRHGPCPGCGGKDRFRFDDVGGNGSFICSQGGGGILASDGIGLLMHVTGWEWKKAVNAIGELLQLPYSTASGPISGSGVGGTESSPSDGTVAQEPMAERQARRPELDLEKVQEFTRGLEDVTEEWLMRRSKVDVAQCDSRAFLGHLYRPDERVLVFTNEHSQGDFIAWLGGRRQGDDSVPPCLDETRPLEVKTYRLSQDRNVKAVVSALPKGGPKGVWFLTNPVSGKWEINPRAKVRGEDAAAYSRRSAENITSWRFFVLESDVLDPASWLKVLANLTLPIAAIYTSGGKSIHALMEYEMPSKANWDAMRDAVIQLVCPLGADAAALSAVRLSRLPSTTRGTPPRPQRLLYLNPNPGHEPIRLRLPLR